MSQKKINIVVAGATGYIGLDLVFYLSKHPRVNISYLCAQKNLGKDIKTFDKRIIKKLPKITEKDIERNLDTKDLPGVDLLIRTGGEKRLSNFLIWQLAYSELYFEKCLWPDFNKNNFINALLFYQSRNRRFGKLNN